MAEYAQMRDSGVPWIQSIPEPWGVRVLFQLADQVKNKNKDLLERNLLSLSYGRIKRKDINNPEGLLPESFDGYNIIEANDIVLRLTDLQNDHTSLRVGQSAERGIITSAYTTLRPSALINPQYLYYVLHAYDLIKGFYGMGAGVRQGLNYDEVKTIKVPFPSMQEQTSIVAYLDDQIGQIDSIIAEAQASIDEYKQWKASVIFEAVTKGLFHDAPKRESGIEWIGAIPSTWAIRALFQLVTQVKNKNRDLQEKNLLSLSYGKIKRKNIETTDGLLPASFDGYNIIEANDIVLRLTDLQNDHTSLRVGRATERGIVTSAYVTIRPMKGINSEYLYYVLHAFDLKKGLYRMGSGVRQGLNYDEVKLIKIPYAPSTDQRSIVSYLNDRCEKIDSVIDEKQSLINDLEAYKRSLIYEIVTGKRKVV